MAARNQCAELRNLAVIADANVAPCGPQIIIFIDCYVHR
jgi:hypothetical protein